MLSIIAIVHLLTSCIEFRLARRASIERPGVLDAAVRTNPVYRRRVTNGLPTNGLWDGEIEGEALPGDGLTEGETDGLTEADGETEAEGD